MGALFLHHKNTGISESLIRTIYSEKKFSDPHITELGDYKVYLFPKQLIKADNYVREGENSLFACGSLFYKGNGYDESLRELLKDFFGNGIDKNALFGNFVLLFYSGNDKALSLLTDGMVAKNLYFDKRNRILTTDFLAIPATGDRQYTLNKPALIENITTGNLISPDTYINEIERVDRININELAEWFQGISFRNMVTDPAPVPSGFDIAVKEANDAIKGYFKSAKNLTDQYGAHIGLTGGFDSRLMLIHARKQLSRLITNSFWRPASAEYQNARLLAQKTSLEFITFENDPFISPSEKEMLHNSLFFFDGQVRSQNIWTEEFNQSDYSRKIASGHYVGFHGCGGEQYRNAERITRKIAFDDFVRYDWMFKQCDNLFTDKELRKAIQERIKRKIIRLTGITRKRMGLFEVKKIQNEVWNTANRLTRVNILNQQQFYFAPFTEFRLSQQAYNFIPFLGSSFDFQLAMIKESDIDLASVMTNYGFSADAKEPWKQRLLPLVTGIMPRRLFYFFYNNMRKRQDNHPDIDVNSKEFNSLKTLTGQKIDLDKLSRNKNLAGGIKAMTTFLQWFYGLQKN